VDERVQMWLGVEVFSGGKVWGRDQTQMNSKLKTAASFAKNFCPKENPQTNKFDYATLGKKSSNRNTFTL